MSNVETLISPNSTDDGFLGYNPEAERVNITAVLRDIYANKPGTMTSWRTTKGGLTEDHIFAGKVLPAQDGSVTPFDGIEVVVFVTNQDGWTMAMVRSSDEPTDSRSYTLYADKVVPVENEAQGANSAEDALVQLTDDTAVDEFNTCNILRLATFTIELAEAVQERRRRIGSGVMFPLEQPDTLPEAV